MARLAVWLWVVAVATADGTAAPVPKDFASPTGVIVMVSDEYGARLLPLNGGPVRELSARGAQEGSVSPDGKRLAILVRDPPPDAPVFVLPGGRPVAPLLTDWKPTCSLHIVDLNGKERLGDPMFGGVIRGQVVWAPDGKTVFVTDLSRDVRLLSGMWSLPGEVTACDITTGKARTIPQLHGHTVSEVSPDGKFVRTTKPTVEGQELKTETVVFARDTWKPVPAERFLADDRVRLVTRKVNPRAGDPVARDEDYLLFDPATKSERPLTLPAEIGKNPSRLNRVILSPDGRRLLFAWSETVPAPPDWPLGDHPCRATRLTMTDLNGKNAKTIYRAEIKAFADLHKSHWYWIEWR